MVGLLVLLGLFCVGWVCYKIYWGMQGVKLHRWLMVNDRYYLHLHQMEQNDKVMGMDASLWSERISEHFLEAMSAKGMLSDKEYKDATREK
jgi:hypothetical protein